MTEKRILVVDDDDAIRALLFIVLRKRGFVVDTARNGAEALERCGTCQYSVALLDLMMPRKSGYEVLDELAKVPAAERPVVIVLTAGPEPRNLDPQLVAGSIRKPFDMQLLVDTVTGCVDVLPLRDQRDECPTAESEG